MKLKYSSHVHAPKIWVVQYLHKSTWLHPTTADIYIYSETAVKWYGTTSLIWSTYIQSLQSQLTAAHSGERTWPPISCVYGNHPSFWPRLRTWIVVGCLNIAELLSLMRTIYSLRALECNLTLSAVSGDITIKTMPHGCEYFQQVLT